jgi:hypothetical protein
LFGSAHCWPRTGDLGTYDVLPARLDLATHVVVLDPPLWLCCLRVICRGRENLAFGRRTLTWRQREWPRIRVAIHDRRRPATTGVGLRSPGAAGSHVPLRESLLSVHAPLIGRVWLQL